MAKRKSYTSKKKPSSKKKSTSKKSTSKKKSTTKRVSLAPMREQLAILVNQANVRVNDIRNYNESNQPIVSRAIEEAKRTLLRSPTRIGEMESGVLFKSNLRTRQQIMKEFSRVQSFLNDYTSTVEGSKRFNKELQSLSGLKGAFGGEWQATTGKHYDTSRINEETAKNTFEIYNRIVSSAGGWERAIGFAQGKESLIGYGSENLIIAIYDMVENSDVDWEKFFRNRASDEDVETGNAIMGMARQIIEEGISTYQEMEKHQVSDYDYGIVFDDEDAKARRAYYSWRWEYRQKLKNGG